MPYHVHETFLYLSIFSALDPAEPFENRRVADAFEERLVRVLRVEDRNAFERVDVAGLVDVAVLDGERRLVARFLHELCDMQVVPAEATVRSR